MPTPRWPLTLPQQPDPNGGWVRTPQVNNVSFQPAVGGPIVRRRGTVRAHQYEVSFPPFTEIELDTFEAFFEDDLADGSLHFLWADPVSELDFKWRIVGPYQVASTGAGLHRLSLSMLRLPGAAV